MKTVSVAMATYNGSQFLQAQLESLAAQTRLPDELVVCDDGSRDDTLEILETFASTAPFLVRIHRNETNLGYAQNFSKVFSLTIGDVVFPADQDDVWFPEKLETMLAELRAHPKTQLMLCDTLLCDAKLAPNGETKLGRLRANGLPDTAHVMGCCIAMRREFLNAALPVPNEVKSHDNWLVQLADELKVATRLEQALQSYRLHGENASDFFVNRPERQTRFVRLRRRVGSIFRRLSTAGGMEGEYLFLKALEQHLTAKQPSFATLIGAERTHMTLIDLRSHIELLSARLCVRQRPRLRRITSVIALWRARSYETVGLSAALKDLYLPRSRT